MSDTPPAPPAAPPRRTVLLGALASVAVPQAAAALAGIDAAPVLAPDAALTRIAFGSCADQKRPQPIWDAVLAARPELFLFAGDNVYGDSESPDLAELRTAYAQAMTIDGYRTLRRTVPVMAVWDDHDMGRNDGGASYPLRRESQRLFAEFWELPPEDPRWNREGVHTARVIGPPGRRVQVIMLDTRSFRSPLLKTDQRGAPGRERYLPDPDPAKTMLGPDQWAWLEERLREPAEVRLLVSSIQVLAEGHGWERWGNLPQERDRLYDLIGRSGAEGVILLSGDRHVGALYREAAGLPYPLTEITSSGLNQVAPANSRESGPNRLGDRFIAANFGRIDLDWEAGTVALALVDAAGTEQRTTTLRLSDLRRS
ncbi:alkaline phosphatase D [Azospirillum agricola]|uniref:alkaline phosphatase D family protein n=1 Tax=Azospirillum agricola TaxID=1720247 RepID=UPI001AE344A8|nr:alkaline phosphatase D family protein [Azospirillum agricola]MBP2230674.1 alkaline phosphatase D [Azospirillum agricola]